MLEIILFTIIAFLATGLGLALFYLWKFAKIIMIFEDDLDESIQTLIDVDKSIKDVLEMQMFFDSPEVRKTVQIVLDDIKICRSMVDKIVHKFVDRSKRKYVTTWVEEEAIMQRRPPAPQLPGQPPGTPNPLEVLQREGMVLDVRH